MQPWKPKKGGQISYACLGMQRGNFYAVKVVKILNVVKQYYTS